MALVSKPVKLQDYLSQLVVFNTIITIVINGDLMC